MLEGRYFFPRSARFVAARAFLSDPKTLVVQTSDGAALAEAPMRRVRVSARLGSIARRFELPGGALFETYDNDGTDALLRAARLRGIEGWVDRLERSWRSVAAAIVLAGLAGYGFVAYGIPAIALGLALNTPSAMTQLLSDQTLELMDRDYLTPSALKAQDRAKAQALFTRVASYAPRGKDGYRLLFRHGGPLVGANAFALPDGRVVMTDQLWQAVENDDEIEGVFAHEMAHVDHAHGLQRLYDAALVPAAIAVVTGDLSQVSQLSVLLPGILLQSAYSRGFEQQADDDAARLLLRMGGHPARMADLLERLDASHCKKGGCTPSWLGNHPATAIRAVKLRAEEPRKK
jgi:Zn-dependent protease with chaperone function